MSDSLQPHESQHARTPCPSPTPRVHSNSCHRVGGAIQPSQPLLCLSPPAPIPPSIRVFSNESTLCMRGPKYWSFSCSISPSGDYSGLISFRIDWLDLLAVLRDSQESSSTPQFKSIHSSVLSFLYGPTLTSVIDYWKNHSFD